MKNAGHINYFEEIYLKKKSNCISLKESKRLRKLITPKVQVIRKINLNKTITGKTLPAFTTDIDNFLLPFEF